MTVADTNNLAPTTATLVSGQTSVLTDAAGAALTDAVGAALTINPPSVHKTTVTITDAG